MTSLLRDEGYSLVLLSDDMCKLLRIDKDVLYDRIRAGQVPAFRRTGRRYEWLRPEVERWLTHRRAHVA